MDKRNDQTPEGESFEKAMKEIFYDSIEVVYDNDMINNKTPSTWKKIKTGFLQAKNTLKFNSFNFLSQIEFNKDKPYANFFSHKYNINNEIDEDKFNEKISSLIFISYRSNFPKIKVEDSKGEHLTSDCGWGCMIRSCQMLFARAIYKLFKKQFDDAKSKTIFYHSLFYFLEYSFNFIEMPDTFSSIISKYLANLYSNPNNTPSISYEFKAITSPFAIQNICAVGTLFNRKPGKYYSDVHIPHIFKAINNEFNAIPSLGIFPFQTVIDKSKIIEECFTLIEEQENEILINSPMIKDNRCDNCIEFKGKKYLFEKAGLIFTSVRLGIKTIAAEYFDSIKKMFECKEFMGFVGGKGVYAYYFFGHDDDYLFYLDPHFPQEAISIFNIESFASYEPKKIFHLKFKKLKPALTFAFLFKNIKEFNNLFNFIDKYLSNNSFSCISVSDNVIQESYAFDEEMEKEDDDF